MYLWKINDLKSTLSSTGLSQKSSFLYLLLWGLAISGGMEFMAYAPYENVNIWNNVITVGYLVLVVIGTYAFYVANGGQDGKALIDRYMSIGFVVTIRLIPLMILLMVGLGVYIGIKQGVDDDFMTTIGPADAVVTLSWVAIVWYRMAIHVRDVANA